MLPTAVAADPPSALSQPAAACVDPGPCVVLQVVGGSQAEREFASSQVSALADLGNPDPAPAYQTQSNPDGPRQSDPQPDSATSVRALAEATRSGSADEMTFAEVFDSSGQSHPLLDGELAVGAAAGFEGGLQPAVYLNGLAQSGQSFGYIRPLRGARDVNSTSGLDNGYFNTSSGGALSIVVHTSGQLLRPRIEAEEVAQEGGTSTYTLDATTPDAPGGTTYAWDFGDGSSSSNGSNQQEHDFDQPHLVRLVVSAPDSSVGYTSYAIDPSPDDSSPENSGQDEDVPPPGSGGGGDGGDGGGDGGGTGDGGGGGAADGDGGDGPIGATGGGTDNGTGDHTGGDGPDDNTGGEGPGRGDADGDDPPGDDAAQAQEEDQSGPDVASGMTVDGLLLTGGASYTPPSLAASADANADVEASRAAGSSPVDPLVWAGLALPLLLLAGAASEAGWLSVSTLSNATLGAAVRRRRGGTP